MCVSNPLLPDTLLVLLTPFNAGSIFLRHRPCAHPVSGYEPLHPQAPAAVSYCTGRLFDELERMDLTATSRFGAW